MDHHEEPMHDRTIYPDGATVSGSVDWRGYVSVLGAVIAITISLGTVIRTAVTDGDLDKFQQTFHDPLQRRVESLEVSRDGLSKEIGTLAGTINVMKVQIASVEASQTRLESSLRETTGELKQIMRDIGVKIERLQQGRIIPQIGDEMDWYYYMPKALPQQASRYARGRRD